MLKFIKNHMATISDIDIYPIISFLLFFSVFILMVAYVIAARKEYMTEMAELPFKDDEGSPTSQL